MAKKKTKKTAKRKAVQTRGPVMKKTQTIIKRVSSIKNALPITKSHGIGAAGGAAVAMAEKTNFLSFLPSWSHPLAVAVVAEKMGFHDASIGAAGVMGYKLAHKFQGTTPTAGSMEDVGQDPDRALLEAYARNAEVSGPEETSREDW